jgi:uncharacterized protein
MGKSISRHDRTTAFITGGTSGIGFAYAEAFAARGYDLILVGLRDDQREAKLIDSIRKKHGVSADMLEADLSKENDIGMLERFIGKRSDICALVNCAGFGLGMKFEDAELEKEDAMVKVHCLAPMNLMRAVLPQMRSRAQGVIINVASLGGFFPMARNSVYGGTKAFLIMLTESLHLELKGSGIRVQVIAPGFVKTHFHDTIPKQTKKVDVRRLLKWMTADQVVRTSMKFLEKGKVVCIPGFEYKVLRWVSMYVPRGLYYRLFGGAR